MGLRQYYTGADADGRQYRHRLADRPPYKIVEELWLA
jgi:hypothetical protein